jgi:hypothetical protein
MAGWLRGCAPSVATNANADAIQRPETFRFVAILLTAMHSVFLVPFADMHGAACVTAKLCDA